MYESEIIFIRHSFRSNVLPRPPPDHIYDSGKDNRGHGSQDQIIHLIRNHNEATQVFNPSYCPVPDNRHRQGVSPVDGD